MSRNAATLAARLAGRPLLMRGASAEHYARQLLALSPGHASLRQAGRTGFASLLSAARQAVGIHQPAPKAAIAEADGARPAAEACYPLWLDQAEGGPDDTGYGWCLKGSLAIVDISGPLLDCGFGYEDWDGNSYWIHGYDTLAVTFAEVDADARVKGVMVTYDTPGGLVDDGLPALAAQIRAGGKPIWASCKMAASAGYWLASACDQVVAPHLALVGSIGAVVTHCDMSGALEKDGFRVEHIQFGSKKTNGSPFKPLSESARADWQAEIDEIGELFVAGVVAGRSNLTPEAVLATEAGCFMGDHKDPKRSAKALGLTDAVMTERVAFAALRALIGDDPTISPAAPAAPAATMETHMIRSQVMAAASKAGLNANQLKKLEAELPADEENDEEDTARGGEGQDTVEAAGADSAAGASPDGEDDEDEGDPPDAKTAKAILDSPQAKGREPLARELAFTPGMSLATAERLMAKAPKGNALGARLENSPRLGADAPPAPKAPSSARSTFAKNREAGLKGKTR